MLAVLVTWIEQRKIKASLYIWLFSFLVCAWLPEIDQLVLLYTQVLNMQYNKNPTVLKKNLQSEPV